jgi:hypothetical protein
MFSPQLLTKAKAKVHSTSGAAAAVMLLVDDSHWPHQCERCARKSSY